ncbi:MAG: hypothetical protein R2706_00665 [Acidimicrobiales bacterium]
MSSITDLAIGTTADQFVAVATIDALVTDPNLAVLSYDTSSS